MTAERSVGRASRPALVLGAGLLVAAALKAVNVGAGGPQIMIDDHSLLDGGFLVWFGNAPPQHAYLEAWACGITSLLVYLWKTVAGGGLHGLGNIGFWANLVPAAYRDYYLAPDLYYQAYRVFLLAADLSTALILWRISRLILGDAWDGFGALVAPLMYLFSFNTYWCILVGRPDTLVSLAAVAGLWFYLTSDHGRRPLRFGAAAALFGIAAGLKLHGIFFVLFACVDILRVSGWREGIRRLLVFVPVALFLFLVADGSLLFDPVLYLKSRWLTYAHDASPWIRWGDQFPKMLGGSGWVAVPVVIVAAFSTFAMKRGQTDQKVRSIVLISILWVALFGSIRQLRAYWMLPALPFFYLTFSVMLMRLGRPALRGAVVLLVGGILVLQSAFLVRDTRAADMGELRRWVRTNVAEREPFYLVAYEVLQLPRSTRCLGNIRRVIEDGLGSAREMELPFAFRHAKNWERRSSLRLMDMLDNRVEGGYEYYSTFLHPFYGGIRLDDMRYVIVQGELLAEAPAPILQELRARYVEVARVRGPGGTGTGLRYLVFRRVR